MKKENTLKAKKEPKQNGRPQKYTPETLLNKAIEYFDQLSDPKNLIDKWKDWKHPRPKTLSWLCLYLWVSKDYISEKAKDENFSEAIKRIRLVVENSIEEWILLNIYNPTSGIFNLKNNFDWKDKQEIDTTQSINIDLSGLSTAELIELYKKNLWKK